jgi:hypothetical protein
VIKQVTGSTEFPPDRKEQAHLFADLLEGYYEMMETAFQLPTEKQWHRIIKHKAGCAITGQEYIEKLRDGCEYTFYDKKLNVPGLSVLYKSILEGTEPLEDLFHVRSQFNVDAFLIGSGQDLDYGVHWPATLEEHFTSYHQNMEYIVNYLKTQCGLNKEVLGAGPKSVCEAIETSINPDGFSTISMSEKEIELGFNIPLRQHAAFIGLRFSPDKPEGPMAIRVQVAGVNENERWYKVAFAGALLNNTQFESEPLGPNRVSMDWRPTLMMSFR